MDTKIIRCLFGNPGKECYWSKRKPDQTIKLVGEIEKSLRYEWAKNKVVHYVMGKDNVDLLKYFGAKNIVLIDNENTLVPNSGVNPLYNKVFLINEAIKIHGEVLFLDFDTLPIKENEKPDDEMWDLLRNKKGRFDGVYQAPFVTRTRPFCLVEGQGGFRDPNKIFTRKTITTCMVYCRDKNWVQDWLDHFVLYQDVVREVQKRKVFDKHDEYILMYYLDKEKGVMNEQEIVDAFEPEIMTVAKSYVNPKTKKHIYFCHG